MDFDMELLKRVGELDDATLKESILKVAESMGVDPSMAGQYVTDMKVIRQAVTNLTPQDMANLQNALGEETLSAIESNVRKELGEG